jgi:hypothetical protein
VRVRNSGFFRFISPLGGTTPMKEIRVLALGSILLLGFATGLRAQTQTETDQPPAAQSEDKTAPATDQQSTTESEQSKPTPEDDSNSDSE